MGWHCKRMVLPLINVHFIVVVQSLSCVQLSAAPWTAAHQASLSLSVSQSLPKFMSIQSVMPSNHLILCCPLLPLPSIFPSIRVFSKELALCIRWPKYWRFSISPSNEYSGLISFRIDWFDLLVVQGILKSVLQHQNSKASILWCSAFFMVQLSHPYMITGKTIALTIQTFLSKVMSLLFVMLSRVCCGFPSKKQVSSNFTGTVTVCSDFWSPVRENLSLLLLFPLLFAMKFWDWMPWSPSPNQPWELPLWTNWGRSVRPRRSHWNRKWIYLRLPGWYKDLEWASGLLRLILTPAWKQSRERVLMAEAGSLPLPHSSSIWKTNFSFSAFSFPPPGQKQYIYWAHLLPAGHHTGWMTGFRGSVDVWCLPEALHPDQLPRKGTDGGGSERWCASSDTAWGRQTWLPLGNKVRA